jgi:hypothetical protein
MDLDKYVDQRRRNKFGLDTRTPNILKIKGNKSNDQMQKYEN